jgi:hypothetical protein
MSGWEWVMVGEWFGEMELIGLCGFHEPASEIARTFDAGLGLGADFDVASEGCELESFARS